jgi:PAS domain S-box-containing protein
LLESIQGLGGGEDFRWSSDRQKVLNSLLCLSYDKQKVLNSLLRLSLEDIPLNELLQHTLDLLTTISWLAQKSKGVIFLIEDQPEILVMKAQKGLTGPHQASCAQVPFGRCICGLAAATRQLQFVAGIDARHEIQYEAMTPHGHYCVPILSGARLLGAITLAVKEKHRRSPKEEEFLTAIANTLAGIIIRREAEAAQRKIEQELKSLVENIHAVVFKGSVDCSIDFFDDKIEEMTGYPKQEFDSRRLKWIDLVLPEDVQDAKQTFIQGLRTCRNYVREFRIRTKQGEVIWIEERSHIVCNQKGRVEYINGVFFDITKRKERDFIINTFGRYVDPDIALKLLSRKEAPFFTCEKREVAILFADIRDFTPTAESLKPEDTIYLVNRFFSTMVKVIKQHGGFVLDFAGDSVLSFFDPADGLLAAMALRAVRCAFKMQEAVNGVNAPEGSRELPPLAMGIGLHVGEVVVGNIGSESMAKYGIMGLAVNLTHRLQGQARGGEVIVSEAFYRLVEPEVVANGSFQTHLKGIQEPMNLYAVEYLREAE